VPETHGEHAHATPAEHGGEHAADHGHEFDFQAAMKHHNLPYPAWEPIHGSPLLIFDLGTYAAYNYKHLSHTEGFADVDPSAYRDWAEEALDSPEMSMAGFAQGERPDADELAQAMQVADDHAILATFPKPLSFFNQQIFFGTAFLLLVSLVVCVLALRKREQIKPVNRLQHALEATFLYIKKEVVDPNIPHAGAGWSAHIAALFIAILTMNLFGLIPGTGTMSSNIGVTVAFSLATLVAMLFFGMKEQGIKYWINIVPVHWSWNPFNMLVWLLLWVIEVLGLVIKPAALAIRLFANMFAGHTALLALLSLGLIVQASRPESFGLSLGLQGLGFALGFGIYFLELLVAFVQAYIFTLLTAIFVGMSIHPEH